MLANSLPRTWRHLEAARAASADLRARWGVLLDLEPFQVGINVRLDGTGEITGTFRWGDSEQEALTTLFRKILEELWSALDAMVAETYIGLSVLHRPMSPDSLRYFPVAASSDELEVMLAQGCLDGILEEQVALVRACQPFATVGGDSPTGQIRDGIRHLHVWTSGLKRGDRIAAWATPGKPDITVPFPSSVRDVNVSEPCFMSDATILATVIIDNYVDSELVTARAGTHIDFCFPTGLPPENSDDSFDQQLDGVIRAVLALAALFAQSYDRVPGSRHILLADDEATPRKDSSRTSAGDHLQFRGDPEPGTYLEADDEGELHLIVVMPDGFITRTIPNASPLRPLTRRGIAAEGAVLDAAATWGLPDFVFTAPVERKGSGVREVADGLVIVGNLGVVVQSKAREGTPSTADKERNWVRKHVEKGCSQARGTIRRVTAGTTNLVDGRGQEVTLNGAAVSWVGVVIVDHPQNPQGITVQGFQDGNPLVVLYRRDWEFLFTQLRSTHAVAQYLHRVAGEPSQLGEEWARYFDLAAADSAAEPGELDAALQGIGTHASAPMLPVEAAGTDDAEAHGIVRLILEDIATSQIDAEHWDVRRDVLASIDTLPVAHRTSLGRFLLDTFGALQEEEDTQKIQWAFRTFLSGSKGDQVAFGVCNVLNDTTRNAFHLWLRLRHHDRCTRTGTTLGLTSIGVLLTPRPDQTRTWDTTMAAVSGDPGLSPEEIKRLRKLMPDPTNS